MIEIERGQAYLDSQVKSPLGTAVGDLNAINGAWVSPQGLTPSAVVQISSHAGVIDKQSDSLVIKHLASLTPLEYDRVRKEEAKKLGVGPLTLDLEVKSARRDDVKSCSRFSDVEPYSSPIDPAQLLSEVAKVVKKCIVLDDEQANAAALWIAHTWFIDELECSPLAIVNAPEKACGKTQLLNVIGRMAYKPLPAANASPSALFRAIEAWKPTILIDEADTFFKDNFELHGMVNAGNSPDGYVLRSESVKDTFEPRSFSVFCPKALAGIALERHLPDATMSRGIVFNMRRKLPHESVERLRDIDKNLFIVITEKLARFAQDYSSQVKQARPILPNELSDRNQDNWGGLLAIASCAGDVWLALATAAALKLSASGEKTVSTGNELLADIQQIFESKKLSKISTADLIAALCEDQESAWAAYNRGNQITPRQVAKQLAAYGIASKTIRLGTYDTPKGFELSQFSDAFERYLTTPLNLPPQTSYPPHANKHGVSTVADIPPQHISRHSAATPEAQHSLGCGVVADKNLSTRDAAKSMRI